jgi:hypothetical protein
MLFSLFAVVCGILGSRRYAAFSFRLQPDESPTIATCANGPGRHPSRKRHHRVMPPPDIARHERWPSLPLRPPSRQRRFLSVSPSPMQDMIDKLMAYPLVPAALALFWLVLEWLALLRLRRDRRQRSGRGE